MRNAEVEFLMAVAPCSHSHYCSMMAQILDMETAAKLVQATNREAFDVDRVKYEEEIASLRRIIDGVCVCVCVCV